MKLLLSPLLGGLSHNSAKIWARADSLAQMHVWLATKDDFSDAKYIGAADLLLAQVAVSAALRGSPSARGAKAQHKIFLRGQREKQTSA